MDIKRFKNYLETRGYEDHGRFRGHSGACFLLASKRGDWDYGDKECRDFIAYNLEKPENDLIRYRFSTSRTVIATTITQKMALDPEDFLLRAGLLRFKRFLKENDSPGRAGEFMLHSRSKEDEFEIEDQEELRIEVQCAKYQLLDLLFKNKYLGKALTSKKEIENKICTTYPILDSMIALFGQQQFIAVDNRSDKMKLTPKGELEMDRLKLNRREHDRNTQKASNSNSSKFDLFISHASEDKEAFVRPLAKVLKKKGLKPWFDEFSLNIGDSLRESIDHGLSNSRYGLVIISHNFFSKEWPKRELNALFSIMKCGEILPVWHKISCEEVKKHSPMLADIVAVRSSSGIPVVVDEIIKKISKK